jgi:hypothetical protein
MRKAFAAAAVVAGVFIATMAATRRLQWLGRESGLIHYSVKFLDSKM